MKEVEEVGWEEDDKEVEEENGEGKGEREGGFERARADDKESGLD